MVLSAVKRALMTFAPLSLVLFLAACDSPEERLAKHFERAEALMAEGVPEKAILEYRNALEIDGNYVPAHFAIGEILEAQGDYQAAFSRFKKVSELAPEHGPANSKLAHFYLLANELDEAQKHLAVSLRVQPRSAEILALKASIEIRRGDLTEARSALDEGLAIAPGNVEIAIAEAAYLVRKDGMSAALAHTVTALGDHPENLQLHILKLQLLRQMGNQPGIGEQLKDMVRTFPDDLRFRQALVQWAAENDEDEVAQAELRTLVELQPDNIDAVVDLVRFLHSNQGPEAARSELQILIDGSDEVLRLKLMLAQIDVEIGNREKAIADLKVLVGDAGADANIVRVALARILISEGDDAEADEVINAALKDSPNDVDVLVLSVGRLLERNLLDDAGRQVSIGLNEAPDDVRLLLLAGQVHEFQNNISLASDHLAKAVKINGYQPETAIKYVQFLLRTQQYSAAEIVLTTSIRQHPDALQLYALLGFARIRLEDWKGAEQAARGLEGGDPDRAQQLRAAILIEQERFDEGAELLRASAEGTQDQSVTVAALVQTYLRNDKADEAEAFLEDLLEKNPENIQALGIRGNLHLAVNDYANAKRLYEKILTIDPGNSAAHSAMARLATAEGDDVGAEKALRVGLDLSPDSLLLLARLAQIQEMKGEFDAAIETYERLYARVPNSLVVINNLASLLADHRADDPASVERAYTIASRLSRLDLPQYRDTYGWTRYLRGEYDEALERIAPLVDALPGNPWVSYHLGMIHAALDQPVEARKHLEASLLQSAELSFPPTEKIRKTLKNLRTN